MRKMIGFRFVWSSDDDEIFSIFSKKDFFERERERGREREREIRKKKEEEKIHTNMSGTFYHTYEWVVLLLIASVIMRAIEEERRRVVEKSFTKIYMCSIVCPSSLYTYVSMFNSLFESISLFFYMHEWVVSDMSWCDRRKRRRRREIYQKLYLLLFIHLLSTLVQRYMYITHTHTHTKQTLMILCPCSRNSTRRKNNWRRRGNERKLIMERRERHGRSRTIRSQRPRNLLLLVRNENQNQSLLPRRVVVVNPSSFLLRLEVERKRDRRKN